MKKITYSLLVFATTSLFSGSAHAELYNIQFNNSAPLTKVYTGAALAPGPAIEYWNQGGVSTILTHTILDSAGVYNGVQVNFGGGSFSTINDASNAFASTPYNNMMDSQLVLAASAGPATMTFTNLVHGGNYELYVYTHAPKSGYGVVLDINGQNTTASTAGNETSFNASNYEKVKLTADNTGTLSFTWGPASGSSRIGINALQLSGPAPEPSSAALVGIGVLFLVAFKLKKSGALSVFNV